jgi:hypothetical protein
MPSREWLLDHWLALSTEDRDKEYWTPAQVAPLLGVSEPRVRALLDEDGDFPGIKPLGRILIHIPSLRLWLRKRMQEPISRK